MEHEHQLTFGPFRLDRRQGCVWRGDQVIPLRPRSLALLGYLVAQAGRLVTKAELQAQVWGDTHISASVLRVSVHEIRVALGDAAGAPHYLETVGRQGYRWRGGGEGAAPPPQTTGPLVGRQGDLAALEGWYQQASQGRRQLVFLSGEAGVGKTTVVEMFLRQLTGARAPWMARGQCVEHYGEGEPYLPFVEALGRLGQGSAREEVRAVLRQYAPRWLVQLPGLVSEPELARLQDRLHGTPPTRMLRELAEALEVLTADRALVLVLEDLQWSDRSTVEALTYLAQRPEPARLLVLGTYRPVEVLLQGHPVRAMVQELGGRGQVRELRLEFLPAADVAAYVAGRLGGPVAEALTAWIYHRTDGNALFLVNIVEHLVQQGAVVRQAGQWTRREEAEAQAARVPAGLRALLLRRIEALAPATQRVLEAASVVGEVFAVAAVAAGLPCPSAAVEAVCEALATQRHFLDDTGLIVWPDGTRSGVYRFQHALYRQVLYERLGTLRCAQLHQRIGVRLEAGYGAQAGALAAQLALHFARGGETAQAVHYLQQAGEHAARQQAHHDAIALLTRGLGLLATLPASPERARHELTLQLTLGASVVITKGFGDPQGHQVYSRAHALSQQVGEPGQGFQALQGLCRYARIQADLRTATALAEELLALASHQADAVCRLVAEHTLGSVRFYRGEPAIAHAHLAQSLRLYSAAQHHAFAVLGSFDPGVVTRIIDALTLWSLGYADQAGHRMREALALADQVAHIPSRSNAALLAAILAQWCRDLPAVQAHAEAVMSLGAEYGFTHRVEQGQLLRGWVRAMQGEATREVVQIRAAVAATQGRGQQLYRPYFLAVLAEAYGQAGQPEAGLQVLAEAVTLMATTEARWSEAEVWRLQGALLLQQAVPDAAQADACFQQALAIARQQQAKSWELRAATSLARLWQQQGKRNEASALLAPVYGWFTEGFDTADLQDAKALLDELEDGR